MENNLSLIEQWKNLQPELIKSFADSLYMISVSIIITVIVGLFLGVVLFLTSNRLLFKNAIIYKTVDFLVNTIRSIPFIILLVFLIPFTLFLLGKSTGPTGAIVPLTVAAIPLFTRLVDTSLNEIDYGVIESAVASGASLKLIVKEVLIPEAMFGIIQSITLTLINLIAFSAMAGVVGGGGIGDLAIRYGYYRFDNFTMWITVILLIILVQITQYIGNSISKKFETKEGIGIDLGIKDFATCSDGQVFKNINKTFKVRKIEKKLKREQRKKSRKYLSCKKMGKNLYECKNFQKQKLVIAKLLFRLNCIRNDYTNKVINMLTKTKLKYITIEDLKVSNMIKNRHLSKAISQQKFYEFRTKLLNKCKEKNIELRIVSTFYPSSKLCSNCGHKKQDLKLKDRIYKCCDCGLEIDRDYNASLNLRNSTQYTILT